MELLLCTFDVFCDGAVAASATFAQNSSRCYCRLVPIKVRSSVFAAVYPQDITHFVPRIDFSCRGPRLRLSLWLAGAKGVFFKIKVSGPVRPIPSEKTTFAMADSP